MENESEDKAVRRTIRVSEAAFERIKEIMEENPELHKGRGAVGVIDKLLFRKFTTEPRGPKVRKKDKKR